jgi:hypothetical protein
MKIFRTMLQRDNGVPLCGSDDCMLGVRPGVDVQPNGDGLVHPGRGGMSATPNNPIALPPHLRPESLGGFSRLPVFFVSVETLPQSLSYVPSQKRPERHGEVEPANTTPLESFQRALCATANLWRLWEQTA